MSFINYAINTIRPKTLSASCAPVFVGTFLTPLALGDINFPIFISLLLTTILLQLGTNLVNDAFDFYKDADTKERMGPVRLVQAGYASAQTVHFLGIFCFGLTLVSAYPFILVGGTPFAILLALSILTAYCYTGGPFPLAYKGFGELFVIIFFGLTATLSAYYFQMGHLNLKIIVASLQMGLLATALIAINNFRDRVGDIKANKLTLSARFGEQFSRREIAFCLFTPFVLNGVWLIDLEWIPFFLPFCTLPQALNVSHAIYRRSPSSYYNRLLAETGLLQMLFGLLLVLGSRWR